MKKTATLFLILILAVSLLAGCGRESEGGGSADDNGFASDPNSTGAVEDAASSEYEGTGLYDGKDLSVLPEGQNPAGYTDNLKIIYTATLSIETLEYDQSYAGMLAELKACGGYVSNSDEWNTGSGARSAELEFRIPVENYGRFLAATDGFGTVTRRSEASQDVTSSYTDIEARIAALRTQEERLLALVTTANDLEVLLQLEDKLAGVRYEIESYTATLNRYDDLISFCTVSVSLSEVAIYSPVRTKTFWQETGETVVNSLRGVGVFLKGLFYVLIYALPYLLIALAIFLIVWRVTKKKREQQKAQRALQYALTTGNPLDVLEAQNKVDLAEKGDKKKDSPQA